MIIGITNETNNYEKRVALTPLSAKKLISQGFDIIMEESAGIASNFDDEDYISAGVKIKQQASKVLQQSDILLRVETPAIEDIKQIKSHCTIIGNFQKSPDRNMLGLMKKKHLLCFALEKMPRLSKTQPFDILSSQDSLSGYQAVLHSTRFLMNSIPLMITSAGNLPPLNFLIIGLGVAGLQAVATAKRLGGKVYTNDLRTETKEQSLSLGGIFVEDITEVLPKVDIIITSAFTYGKKAPKIINEDTIKKLKKGCLLVDLAIASGGNIHGSKDFTLLEISKCFVYANSNFPSEISQSASTLYANNLSNFINYIKSPASAKLEPNFNDEIIKSITLLKG